MVDAVLLLKSVLIGLSIAAPVGPVGLLCIQRTLRHGARIGILSGLGAAAADACYGAVGAFGVSAIMQAFLAAAVPLTIAGALFLGWMGVQLLRAKAADHAANAPDAVNGGRAFATVFALTLSNPLTIFSFIAVFAAIGGNSALSFDLSLLMVFGVFCGSALWWLALSWGVAAVRHKIGPAVMIAINRLAGLFLLSFAAWQLITVLG